MSLFFKKMQFFSSVDIMALRRRLQQRGYHGTSSKAFRDEGVSCTVVVAEPTHRNWNQVM
jgi:aryl carrier-like protein